MAGPIRDRGPVNKKEVLYLKKILLADEKKNKLKKGNKPVKLKKLSQFPGERKKES